MVRNHWDGPDWIPATVIELVGPVTYLVETDRGQRWKRHTDQIKDWLSPASTIVKESENLNSEVDSDNFQTASEVGGPEPIHGTEDTADSSSPGAELAAESTVEELTALQLWDVAIFPKIGNLQIGMILLVLEQIVL